MRSIAICTLGLGLALAGCNGHHKKAGNTLDAMDDQLVNGAVADESPANRSLARDIKVDRGSASLRRRAEQEARGEKGVPGGTGCLAGLQYADDWAARLPADLPMQPGATLQEAAGHDGDCAARVASFTVKGERADVLGWYEQKARAAGYSADRADKGADWNLAGDKGGAAYYLIFGPTKGGVTPVDYIWAKQG